MKKLKRNLYIMKGRFHVLMSHTIERVLHTLSKWGFIVEHKKDYTKSDQGDITPSPDIISDRFVFRVSYIQRKVEFISEYWFETKNHKRIHTVYENHHEENRISFRAEMKSFYAHFSHKDRRWLHDSKNDFSNYRFAIEYALSPLDLFTHGEVFSESYKALKSGLMSKVPEINKELTGASNDGEFTSPSGFPLCDNIVCQKCGYPVFATKVSGYYFECIRHGMIDYTEIEVLNPSVYKRVWSNCLTEIERFCECP